MGDAGENDERERNEGRMQAGGRAGKQAGRAEGRMNGWDWYIGGTERIIKPRLERKEQ